MIVLYLSDYYEIKLKKSIFTIITVICVKNSRVYFGFCAHIKKTSNRRKIYDKPKFALEKKQTYWYKVLLV